MIDRRFISTSLVVNGTVDSLPSNPTTGVQYLVQCDSSNDDLYEYNNYIIRYNGTAWEYIPPRSDMLEIITPQTGEILHYDGSNWIVVASTALCTVDDIVDFDYASTEDDTKISNIAGVTFISSESIGNYDDAHIYVSTGSGTEYLSKSTSQGQRIAVSSGRKFFTAENYGNLNDSTTLTEKALVLSKATGAVYRHDGTKYVPVSSEGVIFVDNVVNLYYKGNSDDSKISVKGKKFISFSGSGYSVGTLYTSKGGNNTADEQSVETNSVFASIEDGYLVSYDGSNWNLHLVPYEGCVIVSKADNSMYIKDGATKKLVAVGNSGSSGGSGLTNEVFTLTSDNISNKSLSLSGNIASGAESSVLCFVGGSAHFAGTDFTASGDSISWNGKTLDTVGLKEGDTVVVQYMKA